MDDLAEELVNHVCGFLDTATCASLSRVSKKMLRIVEPHLYHTVQTTIPTFYEKRESNVLLLLRTLKANSYLRTQVKKIVCKTIHSGRHSGGKHERALHAMIRLLPKVEAIDMSDYPSREYGQLWMKLHNFGHLKRIDADLSYVRMNKLAPTFSLPSIETLNLSRGLNILGEIDHGWQGLQSPVKNLWLTDICHDYRGTGPPTCAIILAIAQSCPRLESLRFVGRNEYYGRYFFEALLAAFTDLTINGRLSKLELWEQTWCDPWKACEESTNITCFRNNAAVEELDLDTGILLAEEVSLENYQSYGRVNILRFGLHLSNTLKTLRLRVSQRAMANIVKEDLEILCNSNVKTKLPSLQELTVYYHCESFGHWLNLCLVGFETKFQEQGVKFAVQQYG
jgi:hypothetical protein